MLRTPTLVSQTFVSWHCAVIDEFPTRGCDRLCETRKRGRSRELPDCVAAVVKRKLLTFSARRSSGNVAFRTRIGVLDECWTDALCYLPAPIGFKARSSTFSSPSAGTSMVIWARYEGPMTPVWKRCSGFNGV